MLRRFAAKVDYVRGAGVVLVHENEKDIFGERGDACLDLLRTVNSPLLRAAFDFANFVQAGDDADGLLAEAGRVHGPHPRQGRGGRRHRGAPGAGAGQLAGILGTAYADGYRGFLSLEPHLSAAGQFSGFSGPALFTAAADALKRLCRENFIPLAPGEQEPHGTAVGSHPGGVGLTGSDDARPLSDPLAVADRCPTTASRGRSPTEPDAER